MENRSKNKIAVSRLGVVLTILFMMVTTSAVTPIGYSLRSNNQMTIPVTQLQYSFMFKEPTLQVTSVQNSLFTKIQMPGCIDLGKQAGDPTLPVKFIQLLLPPKTTVDSIIITGTPVQLDLSGADLTTQRVLPYQNEIPIGSDIPTEFVMNNEVYASNQLYPTENHGEYHIGYSHGYAILDFSLSPVQFIPCTGSLFYYPEMTVTIHLKDNGYVNPLFRGTSDDQSWVENLVSNPDIAQGYDGLPTFEYPGGLCDPSDHYDYVIVTTTQHGLDSWDTSETTPYNWQSLMDHHSADGLACTLVTVEAIYACSDYDNEDPLFNDKPAHIREFCKDAYEDWGTSYVLIAGDSDTIGARQLYYSSEGEVDSDLYWSNLDNNFNSNHNNWWGEEGDLGFDLYSELFIGRVTCDKPQDVSNWLTKSFYYADSLEQDYLDNAAFFGGAMGWTVQGDDFIDYTSIKTVTNWLGPDPDEHGVYPDWLGVGYGFETWNETNPGNVFDLSVKWTAEPPNPGWQGGSSSAAINGLKNAINNDQVTLLSGIAHADPSSSLDVYDYQWESMYTNTKPFFITDWGCHCGDFNSGDGVLESMLFHSDTELAFACVYNTGYGWGSYTSTNSSSALQQKSFWDYLFDIENHSGTFDNWQLGRGHAYSKDIMAPTIDWDWSPAAGSWRGVIECCLLFGDPAQLIKTPSPSDPPLPPSKPVGKTLVVWNVEYSYTSSTTDPNNDQIYYLFDWGDYSNSGWLGPYDSGQTVTGSHVWTLLGTYDVTVKARDVWGIASDLSEPLTVTVTDNRPPDLPIITGPGQIKPLIKYTFTFTGTDGDGQDLLYDIDWGDGKKEVKLGPYHSGETFNVTHSWLKKGNYTIQARTTDPIGTQSEWATLHVVCPRTYEYTLPSLLHFLFERFPNIFPILRHLMGY
jgi:hypothetical protein